MQEKTNQVSPASSFVSMARGENVTSNVYPPQINNERIMRKDYVESKGCCCCDQLHFGDDPLCPVHGHGHGH
jgi:hypothetical protein